MTIEDLKETAALAHLNLEESELAAAFPAFEQMLGYFAAMQAADDDKAAFPQGLISPLPGLVGASGHSQLVDSGFFRLDSPAVSKADGPATGSTVSKAAGMAAEPFSYNPSPGLNENLLNNAGERDGRFLVIPNVL